MRLSLKYQLFLTLLLTGVLAVALLFAINSWSFERGFLNYLNDRRADNLRSVVTTLAAIHGETNDWQALQASPQRWHELLRSEGWPAPPPRKRNRSLRPNGRDESDTRKARNDRRGPGLGKDDRRGNNPRPPPRRNNGSLLLADREQRLLLGDPRNQDKVSWLPIKNSAQTIGFLGFPARSQLDREIDRVFAEQQRRSFALGALAVVVLAALLAIPIASRIVRPLLSVNNAVSNISAGAFEQRVGLQRRDEIGDLADNIDQLALTLEQNRSARQRWIAEISHELRTPVAVLRAELEALQDGVQPLDQDAVASLSAEVQRLHRLIDDLHQLSLSDVGALNYRWQAVDINAITRTFLQRAEHRIEAAGLALNGKLPATKATITGDQQRLEQLLGILLQNSLAYTNAGGSLNITLTGNDGEVSLCWEDSAPGVSSDDLQHLFDPLYRAEQSRNRASGGAGLGLAIAARIVKAHNGALVATHADAGGLALTITLPRSQREATPASGFTPPDVV